MLEIKNLTRKYMTRTAVDNANLTLEEGKTYVLLGPNGSGKTTLMKMIAGLTQPTSGEISFEGERLSVKSKGKIAYMPTENYFYNYMSIKDAAKYYADFFKDFSMDDFNKMLSELELEQKDKIRQLSSGMSAKLRLALTLSRDAKLMMFDEPLNGVDILTRAQVVKCIIENRERGRSMLISTHLVEEIEKYIDCAIYMKKGVIEAAGTPNELCKDNATLTDLYLKIFGHMSQEEGSANV